VVPTRREARSRYGVVFAVGNFSLVTFVITSSPSVTFTVTQNTGTTYNGPMILTAETLFFWGKK